MGNNNLDIKRGYLTHDAQMFETRSGRLKITFRLRVPRDAGMPGKGRGNSDFFTVVAYGDRFLEVYPRLVAGTQVVVIGFTQSRDVMVGGEKRVVVETVAQDLFVSRRDALARVAEPGRASLRQSPEENEEVEGGD